MSFRQGIKWWILNIWYYILSFLTEAEFWNLGCLISKEIILIELVFFQIWFYCWLKQIKTNIQNSTLNSPFVSLSKWHDPHIRKWKKITSFARCNQYFEQTKSNFEGRASWFCDRSKSKEHIEIKVRSPSSTIICKEEDCTIFWFSTKKWQCRRKPYWRSNFQQETKENSNLNEIYFFESLLVS